MLNQVILIGRLTQDPEIKVLKNEKKVANITLAIQRSYKNADGIYETDFISCKLWDAIANNMYEYCKKGDIVGVKGRIQTYEGKIEIIAEKITLLASKGVENGK